MVTRLAEPAVVSCLHDHRDHHRLRHHLGEVQEPVLKRLSQTLQKDQVQSGEAPAELRDAS